MPLQQATDRGEYIKAMERTREQVAELHAQYNERLPLWALFGPGTIDHPGMFVARLWLLRPQLTPTNVAVRAGSLAELRDLLPPTLTCLARSLGDDPNIIESWM